MAFPWLSNSGFETGANPYDSESDDDSILDYPHFSTLARWGFAPYRGAYCMRVLLNGGTTDAYIQEDDDYDTSASGTIFVRWYFYLGRDFAMADGDQFTMATLQSTGPTSEVTAGINRNGSNIRFWFGETTNTRNLILGTTAAPGNPSSALGRWYHAEMQAVIDAGGGNDGTLDAWINDVTAGTQITGLDQGAIIQARFGVIGPDAGTRGTLLIDEIRADDARIYSYKERFPTAFTVTGSEHVFVGPGYIDSATLLTTGASNIMRLWDTDVANTDDTQGFLAELDLSAHTALEGPLYFDRGCYVQLSGTNPRGQVVLVRNSDKLGVLGPLYYSERGMVDYGLYRRPRATRDV